MKLHSTQSSENAAKQSLWALLDRKQSPFHEWQRGLVEDTHDGKHKKRLPEPTERVLDLLNSCGTRAGVVGYLSEHLELSTDDRRTIQELVPCVGGVTVRELKNMPADRERGLKRRFERVTPAEAARPLFWVLVSWRAFEQQVWDDGHAGWLVASYTADASQWRKATRQTLRRLGGAAWDARGKRGVFMDSPISRAWWRCHLAERVADTRSRRQRQELHGRLHESSLWSVLAEGVVANYAVLCDDYWLERAVDACLGAEHPADTDSKMKRAAYRTAIDRVAQDTVGYCGHLLEPSREAA